MGRRGGKDRPDLDELGEHIGTVAGCRGSKARRTRGESALLATYGEAGTGWDRIEWEEGWSDGRAQW